LRDHLAAPGMTELSEQNRALVERLRKDSNVRVGDHSPEVLIATGLVDLNELLDAARLEGSHMAMTGRAEPATFQRQVESKMRPK